LAGIEDLVGMGIGRRQWRGRSWTAFRRSSINASFIWWRISASGARNTADGWYVATTCPSGPWTTSPRRWLTRKSRPSKAWAAVAPRHTITRGHTSASSASSQGRQAAISRELGHDVGSTDVNEYLREISGQDVTAKDFRTWAGTALAAQALQEFEDFDSAAAAKRNITKAIERVAERLGNTKAVCRKCYIHPAVIDAYMDRSLVATLKQRAETELKESLSRLPAEEAAVLALLRQRMERQMQGEKIRTATSQRARSAGRPAGAGKRAAAG
jgi:hypothetical protein